MMRAVLVMSLMLMVLGSPIIHTLESPDIERSEVTVAPGQVRHPVAIEMHWFENSSRFDSVRELGVLSDGDLILVAELCGGPSTLSYACATATLGNYSSSASGVTMIERRDPSNGTEWRFLIESNSSQDRVNDLTILGNDSILIGGEMCRSYSYRAYVDAASSDSCTTSFAGQMVPSGNGHLGTGFIAMIDSGGGLEWVRVFEDGNQSAITSLDTHDSGDIAVSGQFCRGSTGPCTFHAGTTTLDSNGGSDAFAARLSSDGQTLRWMVGIGSTGDEGHYVYDPSVSLGHQQFIHDLVSPVGAVNHDDEFVVGITYCIDATASCELRFERMDVNLPISLSAANADAALLVLQSNGDLRSTEVLRGPQNDSILALEAISGGGLILSGTTTGLSFDVNGQTVSVQTDIDPIYPDFLPRAAFVARLSDAGTYAWVNKVISDERDEMPALLISSDGASVYVGGAICYGWTLDCPNSMGPHTTVGAGWFRTTLYELNLTTGRPIWSEYLSLNGGSIRSIVETESGSLLAGGAACNSSACEIEIGDFSHNYSEAWNPQEGANDSNKGLTEAFIIEYTPDSDGDGVLNIDDRCWNSTLTWTSTPENDFDRDGCRDVDEDPDDDDDGVADDQDDCNLVHGLSTRDRLGCIDTDGDGWSDPSAGWPAHPIGVADAFRENSTQWNDTDNDGYGDNYTFELGPDGLRTGEQGDALPNHPMQWRDRDGDGWGDRPDTNRTDRFPNITSQWNDTDLDGFGDQPAPAFQPDACPSVQGASSHDRFGCPDGDGDGWSDPDASSPAHPNGSSDAFPSNPAQWNDSDGDGYGDNYPPEFGLMASIDLTEWPQGAQSRGDVVRPDHCPSEFGDSWRSNQFGCVDSDGDGKADRFEHPLLIDDPFQWNDSDGDGFGENYWEIDDANGIGERIEGASRADRCPLVTGTSILPYFGCPDLDNDGYADDVDEDPNDPTVTTDFDEDGYDDHVGMVDNCVTVPNPSQMDSDGDGSGDACDDDDDGDGVMDSMDGCRLSITEGWVSGNASDLDGDGCEDDTEDADDDGDGVLDGLDSCSSALHRTGWTSLSTNDFDGDGCHDASEDLDDDNDLIDDLIDRDLSNGSSSCTRSITLGHADVDGDGCYGYEDVDDDGDGILDVNDYCPVQTAPEGNSVLQSNGCYDVAGDTGLDSDQGVSGSGLDFDRLDVIIGGLGLIASILGAFGILLRRTMRNRSYVQLQTEIMSMTDLNQISALQPRLRDLVNSGSLSETQYHMLQEDAERKEAQLKGHGRPGEP